MNKLLAAVVASTFVLGSASGFAADAAKKTELKKEQTTEMRNRAEKLAANHASMAAPATKPELTQEERAEMRNRAARLTAERAVIAVPANATVETSTKVQKHHKTKKTTKPVAVHPRT